MSIAAERKYLSRNEFQDALSLRFGMKISGVALKSACGQTNSTIHTNNCKIGGYVTRPHGVVRNFIPQKAAIVYNDRVIEPHLQETNNHAMQQRGNLQDQSRSDKRIFGFHREYQNSFVAVRVINVQAKFHVKHSVCQSTGTLRGRKGQGLQAKDQRGCKWFFLPSHIHNKRKKIEKMLTGHEEDGITDGNKE